jgi:hypothetical protein
MDGLQGTIFGMDSGDHLCGSNLTVDKFIAMKQVEKEL